LGDSDAWSQDEEGLDDELSLSHRMARVEAVRLDEFQAERHFATRRSGLISRLRFSDNKMEDTILLRSLNMSDILTLEEMKARFPSEWVLINDPQ
jgi:hypothetical protein